MEGCSHAFVHSCVHPKTSHRSFPGAVGKTALLHSYCNNSFPSGYEPTIFDNYSVVVMANGAPLTLALWDTAGQEDYDRLRPLSYPQTDCFLICYSLVNPESLSNAMTKWLPEVHFHAPNAKVLLVGCKSDLRDSPAYVEGLVAKGKSVVDEAEVCEMASRLGLPSFRCSALTQRGLKNVFDSGIREAKTPPPLPPKPSLVGRMLLRIERVCKPRAESHRMAKRVRYTVGMAM